MDPSNTIESPRTTLLPFVTAEEAATMAYPPNAVPGARNVKTLYGNMRVYEWGPSDGAKVLFVHGDATPSLVFSKMAQGLVDAGYRVMLFDLWGRGYSDTPLHCRHDVRLFATQIAFAITSSPISWTGNDNSFSIVAFSLGGPIALAYAGAFPESVRSLVLLGPAGLIRTLPTEYEDLQQLAPASSPEILREKVRQALGVAPSGPTLNTQSDQKRPVPPEEPPSRVEKTFDMGAIVQWQFDHHHGHIHSFQDTVRYGPLQQRQDVWANVCNIVAGRALSDTALHNTKLLVFFGQDDDVVVGKETEEDILKLLTPDHLQVEYLPGGHGFPYPNSEELTRRMLAFWTSECAKG